MPTIYPAVDIHADLATTLSIALAVQPRAIAHVWVYDPPSYVEGGVSADRYSILSASPFSSMPFYDFREGSLNVLRLVPGLTFGPGLVLAN